eukprot:Phypoly_transcript_11960.p1 GENE.Phypoly_transcript_11960~~Phypoly_transcript_11960.p1  ORF type:complete len:321 (+),score=45.38 Phypoly_transcript_11960:112-1074(+)
MFGALPDLNVCTQEDEVSTQIVGWLLTLGTVISFIPQMYALIVNKSLDGLSALTWALNYLSNMCTMVNAVMLNWTEIQCCQELPVLKCIENIVPLVQLGSPTVCTLIVFGLTTIYSDKLTDKELVVQAELKANMKRSFADFIEFIFGSYSFVRSLFVASILLTLACAGAGAALMVFAGIFHYATILYADIIGIFAVVFLMIMYIPQLYTTFKAKHTGSLSVVTLLIQAPGSLVVVYFDAIESHLSWTTWVPFLVSAIQQFILIFMCFYYYLRNRKSKPQSETEPLLSSPPHSLPLPLSASPSSPPPTLSSTPPLYQERIN